MNSFLNGYWETLFVKVLNFINHYFIRSNLWKISEKFWSRECWVPQAVFQDTVIMTSLLSAGLSRDSSEANSRSLTPGNSLADS